jgi:translocation and assembly module TamB
MKSVNKILILFLFLISLSFLGIWEVLQSEWMAHKVSNIATKYVKEVLKSDIHFEKIKFNLLPPAAELKNVRISAEKEDVKTNIDLEVLGFYFNPLDIFNTRFTVDDVVISDGRVKITKKNVTAIESDEKSTKVKIEKALRAIKLKALNEIPVNKITLKNIKLELNSNEIQIRNLKGIKSNSKVDIIGQLQDTKLEQWTKSSEIIDELLFDLTLTDYDLKLNKVILRHKLASLKIDGSISAYASKNIKYRLHTESKFPLEMIHEVVDIKNIGKLDAGNVRVSSVITGTADNYEVINEIQLDDFITDFIDGKKLKAKVTVNNARIRFEEVAFNSNSGEFKLKEPFEFFDFTTKKFVEEAIVVKMKSVELRNALKYLRPKFDMLSGKVSGDLRFELYSDSFKFITDGMASVDTFHIDQGDNLNILKMKELNIDKGIFEINKGIFSMELGAHVNETLLSLNAKIGKKIFQIDMPTAFIDLNDVDNLLGYKLEGKGTLAFNINKNPLYESVMNVKSDLKGFKLLGYQLDQVKGSAKINFDTSKLKVIKVNAANGKSKIKLNGLIDLSSKEILANYTVGNMSFSEVKKIMNPIIGDVKLSSNEIHGDWSMKGIIDGLTTPEGIQIKGDIYGVNNYFFDEGFDVIKCKFELVDKVIKIKDFIGNKSKGKIYSYLEYKIDESKLLYWMNLDSISLDDIFYYSKLPFRFRGMLGGKLQGTYTNEKWSLSNALSISNTYVGTTKYKDSKINIDYTNSNIATNLQLFGKEVVVVSDIKLEKSKRSNLNLKLDVPDFSRFIGLFKGIETDNKTLVGNVSYELESEFDVHTSKFSNIKTNLKKLKILKYPVDINYYNSEAEVIVENGEIKKWDVNIRNRGNYIISRGEGNLYKDYNVKSKVKLHASLLEIFNPIISKADGEIRGLVEYDKSNGKEEISAIAKSNNLSLTTKYLPTSVTNSKLELSLENSVLKINKFIAKLVNGEFEASGGVNFSRVIPQLDIRYSFKDAGLSILKKSTLEFSGTGSLIGKTFPYTLGGDFYIQKFSFINELTDLGGDNSSITKNDIGYLPENDSGITNQLLNLNINVLTREPIYITNSITDLGFVGNVHVLGGEKDIRLDGKISLAPRKNIISFKNNVFELSKGNVFFTQRKRIKNPELDFSASSSINDHQIYVELLGPVQNFKLNLSSEPSLSQSDILSLIAFGYTEDLSSTLSDAEKESMTKAGVGSIIFDSFKINETLKNEFGLEVNLGTEISQSESSYLERGNSDGTSGDGKVTSSTKIELTKKVGDAMSLSVSSTVGGNSQKKQSINLNYDLNKNVSVQGIYESRQDDEVESINDDTSFGTDVKWKWSFK